MFWALNIALAAQHLVDEALLLPSLLDLARVMGVAAAL